MVGSAGSHAGDMQSVVGEPFGTMASAEEAMAAGAGTGRGNTLAPPPPGFLATVNFPSR
jgi:hypothetical protein